MSNRAAATVAGDSVTQFTPRKRRRCREGWFLCVAGGDWVMPVYSSPLAVPGAGGAGRGGGAGRLGGQALSAPSSRAGRSG